MAPEGLSDRDLADKALEKAIDALPAGSRSKKVIGQAGWVALLIGYLLGNIPLSAIAAAAVRGNAKFDLNAAQVYVKALVLFTPWVLLIAVPVFLARTNQMPRLPGYAYAWLAGGLVLTGLFVSPMIGGTVPLNIPKFTSLSPPAVVQWIGDAFGAYARVYGGAVIAGLVEGAALGYWAAYLASPEPTAHAPAPSVTSSIATPRVANPSRAPAKSSPAPPDAKPSMRTPTASPRNSISTPTRTSAANPRPRAAPVETEVAAWVSTVSYERGTTVEHRERRWTVRAGHTSVPGIPPPNDSANWQPAEQS